MVVAYLACDTNPEVTCMAKKAKVKAKKKVTAKKVTKKKTTKAKKKK